MSNKHEVENLMRSTMENLREMIDVNTVIGNPIETSDGSCIIPISKVSFGFASGGSEFGNPSKSTTMDLDGKYPFGGGSGAGVTVKPVAFLVVKNDIVKILHLDHDNTLDRMVDTIPQLFDLVKGFYQDTSDKKTSKKSSPDDLILHNDEYKPTDSY